MSISEAATSEAAETTLVTLSDIEAAAERISDLVLRTPIIQLPHPQRPDEVLHCKAESLQPTSAFKLRGAYNTIAQVLDQAREHGIVAQSSGNHARAVAWLREHPGDPASNLPQDDELSGMLTELVMLSRSEPASPEAMQLNFLLLEQRRLEDEIAAAAERDDYQHRATLSRERAALVERIAHAERQ